MKSLFKILVVDDEQSARDSMRMLLAKEGYEVKTAASPKEALRLLEEEYFPLVITDIIMPGMNGIDFLSRIKEIYQQAIEVIMVTGFGTIETAVQTIKMGAFGYYIKGNHVEELLLEIKKAKKVIELKALKSQRDRSLKHSFLLTSKSPRMQAVWEMAGEVAGTNANVLITGETGVGKEIVAQRIHELSDRADQLFMPINCQNYPDNLIESELFGHEKGAFTGAAGKRIGKIEEAAGGTVFLDEIGEMGLPSQILLLRTLEDKKIQRIGSNQFISVDFRLISATNRDLKKAVEEGRFREDFLYRINTIEIQIPPLRERREDLPDLIDFFVRKYERETGKPIEEIEKETEDYLLQYHYDGNIRELRNMIERMVILSKDGVLRHRGYPESSGKSFIKGNRSGYREAKQHFEKQYFEEVLAANHYNIAKTAAAIGISRRQLFNKITEYQIDTGK